MEARRVHTPEVAGSTPAPAIEHRRVLLSPAKTRQVSLRLVENRRDFLRLAGKARSEQPAKGRGGILTPCPPRPVQLPISNFQFPIEQTDAVTGEDMDYFWFRESRCGKDLRWKIRGAAGEEGEYRITPPFVAEVERISGYKIDVFDNASCRAGIVIWMNYWAPRVRAKTRDELYNLYRRGAAGYRQWKTTESTEIAEVKR